MYTRRMHLMRHPMFLTTLCLTFVVQMCFGLPGKANLEKDAFMGPMELIEKWGYPAEEHFVVTEDGYVLSLCRILHGRGFHSYERFPGPPLLLVHGIISSAADWVINMPHQSLGFVLADAGYDVWMINTRGSPYSDQHEYLNRRSREYLTFSFDDIGRYDLAASIDFILRATGTQQVSLVAWSQGFTECLVLLSDRPEYNLKVSILVGLAPVANITHIATPLTLLGPFAPYMKVAIDIVTKGSLLRSNLVTRALINYFCNSVIRGFCFFPTQISVGASHYQLNKTRIPVYTAHMPAGTTTKNLVHYAQMYRKKNFVKFDYGSEENMVVYGQPEPPEYDLSRIMAPIALFSGPGDRLADLQDIEDLKHHLGSLVYDYLVPQEDFAHLDFVLGIHAQEILFEPVLAVLGQFQLRR
ncbi:lysosomal acid lipase/cholesteryl ester hydrolase-like [Ornithodoros turicata]|uniref:lysosomal acid lipase/cholesteryl ester hydrolase-like n=1 Tax=Ornithodoros turicata TaxID=34597 RepID=UPI00313A33DC